MTCYYVKDPNGEKYIFFPRKAGEEPYRDSGNEWQGSGHFIHVGHPDNSLESMILSDVEPIIADDDRDIIELDLKLRVFTY